MEVRCPPESLGDGLLTKSEIDSVAPQWVSDWFTTLGVQQISIQKLLPLALAESAEMYAWFQYAIFYGHGALYYRQ